ncbi:MAG: hypothetical protein JNK66_08095 [Chitinophagales bacterium]|nr:hypothetical protein [Chitinophagales bacterium]
MKKTIQLLFIVLLTFVAGCKKDPTTVQKDVELYQYSKAEGEMGGTNLVFSVKNNDDGSEFYYYGQYSANGEPSDITSVALKRPGNDTIIYVLVKEHIPAALFYVLGNGEKSPYTLNFSYLGSTLNSGVASIVKKDWTGTNDSSITELPFEATSNMNLTVPSNPKSLFEITNQNLLHVGNLLSSARNPLTLDPLSGKNSSVQASNWVPVLVVAAAIYFFAEKNNLTIRQVLNRILSEINPFSDANAATPPNNQESSFTNTPPVVTNGSPCIGIAGQIVSPIYNDGWLLIAVNGDTANTLNHRFSIDNSTFVASNQFNNISPGIHQLRILTSENCLHTVEIGCYNFFDPCSNFTPWASGNASYSLSAGNPGGWQRFTINISVVVDNSSDPFGPYNFYLPYGGFVVPKELGTSSYTLNYTTEGMIWSGNPERLFQETMHQVRLEDVNTGCWYLQNIVWQ